MFHRRDRHMVNATCTDHDTSFKSLYCQYLLSFLGINYYAGNAMKNYVFRHYVSFIDQLYCQAHRLTFATYLLEKKLPLHSN